MRPIIKKECRLPQKLVARGIALALDELPRRYVLREFLTL